MIAAFSTHQTFLFSGWRILIPRRNGDLKSERKRKIKSSTLYRKMHEGSERSDLPSVFYQEISFLLQDIRQMTMVNIKVNRLFILYYLKNLHSLRLRRGGQQLIHPGRQRSRAQCSVYKSWFFGGHGTAQTYRRIYHHQEGAED